MTIPKRIYYVWGVYEKKPQKVIDCINSWKNVLKDYEIIEINENSTQFFNFQEELQNNKWFRCVYDNKLYAYVADYIRIKVLYTNGGIYLDTDVSVLKTFDDVIDNPAFVGMQNSSNNSKDNLEPAILGSQANNSLLKDILEFYNDDIWTYQIYTMPSIFTYVITKKYGLIKYPDKNFQQVINLNDITIYPEKFFIPYRFNEEFNKTCIVEETHTIHWWNAGWVKDNNVYFLKNKHKADTQKLIEACFKNKTFFSNKFLMISKIYKKISIDIDFCYLFKFKHKFINNKKYLTVFIFGQQIKLWRVK